MVFNGMDRTNMMRVDSAVLQRLVTKFHMLNKQTAAHLLSCSKVLQGIDKLLLSYWKMMRWYNSCSNSMGVTRGSLYRVNISVFSSC